MMTSRIFVTCGVLSNDVMWRCHHVVMIFGITPADAEGPFSRLMGYTCAETVVAMSVAPDALKRYAHRGRPDSGTDLSSALHFALTTA